MIGCTVTIVAIQMMMVMSIQCHERDRVVHRMYTVVYLFPCRFGEFTKPGSGTLAACTTAPIDAFRAVMMVVMKCTLPATATFATE